MTNEDVLLAMLESKEAEADARAVYVAKWVEEHRQALLDERLEMDVATLLAEADYDTTPRINKAVKLLLTQQDQAQMTALLEEMITTALTAIAQTAWDDQVAALHDTMSDEQWEQYQQRSAA